MQADSQYVKDVGLAYKEYAKAFAPATDLSGVKSTIRSIVQAESWGAYLKPVTLCSDVLAYRLPCERCDHLESLAIVAPLSRAKDGKLNQCGVSAALASMMQFAHANFWARDLVIVFPDFKSSTNEWLHAAMGVEETCPLSPGVNIQAGVALEIYAATCDAPFELSQLDLNGPNSLVPNLDYTTAMSIIESHRSSGLEIFEPNRPVPKFMQTFPSLLPMFNLLTFLQYMYLASFVGPDQKNIHGPFLVNGIDMATLRIFARDEKAASDNADNMKYVFERVEAILKSLNNMVQHLHRTESSYVLISSTEHIPIPLVLVVVFIFGAVLLIDAILAVLKCNLNSFGNISNVAEDVLHLGIFFTCSVFSILILRGKLAIVVLGILCLCTKFVCPPKSSWQFLLPLVNIALIVPVSFRDFVFGLTSFFVLATISLVPFAFKRIASAAVAVSVLLLGAPPPSSYFVAALLAGLVTPSKLP